MQCWQTSKSIQWIHFVLEIKEETIRKLFPYFKAGMKLFTLSIFKSMLLILFWTIHLCIVAFHGCQFVASCNCYGCSLRVVCFPEQVCFHSGGKHCGVCCGSSLVPLPIPTDRRPIYFPESELVWCSHIQSEQMQIYSYPWQWRSNWRVTYNVFQAENI